MKCYISSELPDYFANVSTWGKKKKKQADFGIDVIDFLFFLLWEGVVELEEPWCSLGS